MGQPFDLIVLALTDQGGVDGERVLEQGAEGLQTAPDAREIGTLGVLDGDDEPVASDHVQLTELDLLTPVVIAGGTSTVNKIAPYRFSLGRWWAAMASSTTRWCSPNSAATDPITPEVARYNPIHAMPCRSRKSS